MAGKQQGQILYLGGSTSSHASPGGSLSTRFQKISQARNSGITVVNQPMTVAGDSRSRGLGLGRNTGYQPSGQGGQRVSMDRNNHNQRGGPGIQTARGLARAMQERGAGVTDAFLLAPSVVAAHGDGQTGGGVLLRRQAGGATGGRGGNNNTQQSTQAGRHKAMVLGNRPGRKQAGNGTGAQNQQQPQNQRQQQQNQQQQQQHQRGGKAGRGGRGAANGASSVRPPAGGQGKRGNVAGKAKSGNAPKPAPANAENLDSELSAYMMKNTQTAASLLDNDLDTYMADKLEDF